MTMADEVASPAEVAARLEAEVKKDIASIEPVPEKPMEEAIEKAVDKEFQKAMPPNLTAALCQAILEIGAVPKTKPAEGSGIKYEYISDSDIVAVVRGPMARAGLFVRPTGMKIVDKDDYTSNRGAEMTWRVVEVEYEIRHVSGETVKGVSLGEAADSSDKVMNKCMTAAYKYFLRETFALSAATGDPDAEKHERAPKNRSSGGNNRQPGNQQQKEEKKEPEKKKNPNADKPIHERHKSLLNMLDGAQDHDTLSKLVRQSEKIEFDQVQRTEVMAHALARRVKLFEGQIAASDDLETLEAIKPKVEEIKKLSTKLYGQLMAAIDMRSIAITSESGDSGTSTEQPDDVVEMEF